MINKNIIVYISNFTIDMDKMESDRINYEIVRRNELRKAYDAHIKGLGKVIHPMRQDELRRIQIDILSTFDAMANLEYPGHVEYMQKLRRSHADTLMKILAAKDDIAHGDAKYKVQRVDQWVDNQVATGQPMGSGSYEEPSLELNVSAIDMQMLEDEPTANAAVAPPRTKPRPITVRSEVHKVTTKSHDINPFESLEGQRKSTRGRESRALTRTRASLRGRRHATMSPALRPAGKIAPPSARSQIAFDWNKLRSKFTIPKLTSHSVSPPKLQAMGLGDVPERKSIPINRKAGTNVAANLFRRYQTAHATAPVQQHDPNEHHGGTMPISIPLEVTPDAIVARLQQMEQATEMTASGSEPSANVANRNVASTTQRSSQIFQRLGPQIPVQEARDAPPPEAHVATGEMELVQPEPLVIGMGPWGEFAWPPKPKRTTRQAKRHRTADNARLSPACLCCIMFDITVPHTVGECPHFTLFTTDQRKELIDCWYICSDCWHYGHKKCSLGQPCGIQDCMPPHSKLLCPKNELADVIATRAAYQPPDISHHTAPTQPPFCLCCVVFKQLRSHPIWECEHFLGLPVSERNEMIERWNLCRTCGVYGHFGCDNETRCTKYEFCHETHHPVLCEFESTADVEENKRRAILARQLRSREIMRARRQQ